jgi:hypothetical protein
LRLLKSVEITGAGQVIGTNFILNCVKASRIVLVTSRPVKIHAKIKHASPGRIEFASSPGVPAVAKSEQRDYEHAPRI